MRDPLGGGILMLTSPISAGFRIDEVMPLFSPTHRKLMAGALGAVVGCGTIASNTSQQSAYSDDIVVAETVYLDAPVDQVLGVLEAVYQEMEIPVNISFEIVEADTVAAYWEVGNEGFQPRSIDGRALSAFLDCGRSRGFQNADQHRVTLSVIATLRRVEPDGTSLGVIVDASAKPRGATGLSVPCTSKGRLEARLVDLIAGSLEQEGSGDPAA